MLLYALKISFSILKFYCFIIIVIIIYLFIYLFTYLFIYLFILRFMDKRYVPETEIQGIMTS